MRVRLRHLLTLGAFTLGCRASPEVVELPEAESSRADVAGVVAPAPTRVRDLGRLYDEGAAHVGPISLLAASRDGRCALTLDRVGELRLWRGVDGQTRPLRMPAQGVVAMAVDCFGSAREARYRVALVDATGGAELWEAADSGRAQRVARLAPTKPLSSVTVLPQGAGYLALGRDGAVEWLDGEGALRQRIELPRFPVHSIAVGASSVILSSAHSEASGSVTQARWYRLGEGVLEAQGESVRVEAPPGSIHWDHERRRAWYVERAASPHAGQVRLEVLDDPAASMWVALPNSGFQAHNGLLNNGDFVLEWDSNGVLAVDVSGKVRNLPVRGDSTTPALWAGGRRFSGQGEYLGVEDPNGEALFIGYRRLTNAPAALSPDASRLAHAEGDELRIEEMDGTVRAIERDHGSAPLSKLAWVDEQTLVTFDHLGGAALIDTRDGGVLDEVDLHAPFNQGEIRPELGALSIRTHQWGIRQLIHIRDRRFGPQRSVLDNAAFSGVLGAPGGGPSGLWTFDGQKLRRYSDRQLREGLEQSRRTQLEENKPSDSSSMVAMDPQGRAYWLSTQVDKGLARTSIEWKADGIGSRTFELGAGQPVAFSLSPDGRRAAIVLMSAHASRIAYLFDLADAGIAWKRKLANDASLEWALGGEHLLAHSPSSGTQVWSAVDGETQRSRCAFEFEVRTTPPVGSVAAGEYLCG